MASFGYSVYITWKGDAEKGAEMERIVNEAFTDCGDEEERGGGDPRVKKICDAVSEELGCGVPITEDFSDFALFGDHGFPHSAHFYWEETRVDPRTAFNVIFETFPELDFFLEVDTNYCSGYNVYAYEHYIFVDGSIDEECVENFEADNYEDDEDGLSADEKASDDWGKRFKQGLKEKTSWLCLQAEEWLDCGKNALEYIPKEFWKKAQFCQMAVSKYGAALRYVPKRLKTLKRCKTAILQDPGCLAEVPEELMPELLTPELCLAAVKQDGKALEYVPEKQITPELCLAAVEQDGGALDYVPETQITPKLCRVAVEQSGGALEYVQEEQRTPELCLAAVKQYGGALEYVQETQRTPELCRAAVKQDRWALVYVPENLREQVKKAAEE